MIYNHFMSYTNYEDQKAYHKKWYVKNKKRLIEKAKRNNQEYIKRNLEFVVTFKEKGKCKDCGGKFHHSAMDFDHTQNDKLHNVSRLIRMSVSIKLIKKEIEKCDLVCSNCHRVRTYNRLRSHGETVYATGLNPVASA